MDQTLPFYYFTLNDRYRELPSFDERPEYDEQEVNVRNHPLRLHRLRLNQREDSSIFVCGRAILPARHGNTIRQNFHRPEAYLPNPQNWHSKASLSSSIHERMYWPCSLVLAKGAVDGVNIMFSYKETIVKINTPLFINESVSYKWFDEKQ